MDAASEVKSRLGIEDVIAEYVELKRAGRNYKGLSPFSSEKSPSFVVSPEKQIWHDFSSGKGGDMFSFVMEMEGLDFKATLELLARKAGVDLEQFRGGGSGLANAKRKERLYAANELATKFYQVQFSRSQVALEYALATRKFSKHTALEWQLGYSPNTGRALCDFLITKKFTPEEITEAGLSARSQYGSGRNNLRDMFRGRLMIPLHDAQGRVIGFTARLLETADPAVNQKSVSGASGGAAPSSQSTTTYKDAPKYINTPQSPLYDKSRHVYGLHLAKEAIRKIKYVVMVEGNLDVISSHQAGIRQVVATAGTAMTEQHLKVLSKFTGDIRLSYDQDKAGINATERAISVASKVGVSLSMITIPSGKDPDELIKQDAQIWRDVIERHQYAVDWLMQHYENLLDITSAPGKKEFTSVLLPVVRGLKDSVEQDHYLRHIADVVGVRQEALADKYEHMTQELPAPRRHTNYTPPPLDHGYVEHLKIQNRLMALTLMQPSLRPLLTLLTSDMLFTDDARKLLMFLQSYPEFTGQDSHQASELKKVGDYAKIVAIAYEEHYQDDVLPELHAEAARRRDQLINIYVQTQKHKITNQYATADAQTVRGLMQRAAQLDQLLSKLT